MRNKASSGAALPQSRGFRFYNRNGPDGATGPTGASVTGPTGATGVFATGATLFYTNYGTGASGVNVPIHMGDTVYYATDTPDNVKLTVATGATGAVVTINVTGPTGAGSTGNYNVVPGTGASGTIAQLNAVLNNLTFAVTGSSGTSGASGAGIRINVATGPSGPVVTFDASALTQTIQQLQVSQNYDPKSGEMKTGGTYNGKPVYRRAWSFTVTTNAKSPDNAPLIATSGYVQEIINSGGNFATGDTANGVANNVERYNIPATLINWTGSTVQDQVHGFPLVTTDNQLRFASLSTKNRNLAPVYIWVEYTKVNESMV